MPVLVHFYPVKFAFHSQVKLYSSLWLNLLQLKSRTEQSESLMTANPALLLPSQQVKKRKAKIYSKMFMGI